MLVSTLDGKVSALDVRNHGKMVWSLQADIRPLLSSSIGQMEVNTHKHRFYLGTHCFDDSIYPFTLPFVHAPSFVWSVSIHTSITSVNSAVAKPPGIGCLGEQAFEGPVGRYKENMLSFFSPTHLQPIKQPLTHCP